MSLVIRWNQSTEMVMLQNLTGGQLRMGSYDTFRFLIFIARKKTLGRIMIRTKRLRFVIIYCTKSLNPHLQNYFLSYGTKYKKCHKTLYKVAPQWDFVAWTFLQIGFILSQKTLPYRQPTAAYQLPSKTSRTSFVERSWTYSSAVHSPPCIFTGVGHHSPHSSFPFSLPLVRTWDRKLIVYNYKHKYIRVFRMCTVNTHFR